MICTKCGVWYDPARGCDHRILDMGPIYLCPNCDWRVTLGMDFGMEGLPPCSVCNSQMDAIRIIKKDSK